MVEIIVLLIVLLCLLLALLSFRSDANRAGFWTWLALLILVLWQLAVALGLIRAH